jgi:hypothetical protein
MNTSQSLALTSILAGVMGGMLGNAAYTVADNWGIQKQVDLATASLVIFGVAGIIFFPQKLGLEKF